MYAKLTQEKIGRILELGHQGLLRQDIAKELGISGGTVTKYLNKVKKEPTGEEEGSFAKVLALIELLLYEQKKAVLCPICKGNLYPDMSGDKDLLWGCPKCGYRGISEEPEWRKIQKIKLEEL